MVPWEKRANVLEFRQHKRSVHHEHEFKLPSEDEAVKDFLKDALPFLPVDFYELIVHCRQLKQMLILSGQSSSSMSQLPLPSGGIAKLLAENIKSPFALDIPPVVTSKKSRVSECEELQRSGHTTTEEHSVVDRSNDEEDTSSTSAASLSASSSSKQSRRKQQQKCKKDSPEALSQASKAPEAPSVRPSALGNVQVLTRPPAKSSPRTTTRAPSTSIGGWKLCPGFLRFWDRFFGSKTTKTTKATDMKAASSVPVVLASGNMDNNHDNDRRASLTTEPMNNQLNSSEDPGSPVAESPRSATSPHSLLGQQNQVQVVPMQLESLFPDHHRPKGSEVFSKREWQALKLYFTLLDVSGNGVLMEESFVVLLAEQDSGELLSICGLIETC